jgi:hypothetical protein
MPRISCNRTSRASPQRRATTSSRSSLKGTSEIPVDSSEWMLWAVDRHDFAGYRMSPISMECEFIERGRDDGRDSPERRSRLQTEAGAGVRGQPDGCSGSGGDPSHASSRTDIDPSGNCSRRTTRSSLNRRAQNISQGPSDVAVVRMVHLHRHPSGGRSMVCYAIMSAATVGGESKLHCVTKTGCVPLCAFV